VVNLSSQGYSTAQELLVYRKFRDSLSADVVLLAFYTGNDLGDNLRSSFARLDPRGSLEFVPPETSWGTVAALSVQRWLYENSHLVFFLKNAAENVLQTKLAPPSKEKSDRSAEYAYRLTRAILTSMVQEVTLDGARFGVVIIPGRKELEEGSTVRSDSIASMCRDLGIGVLRLDTILERDDFFHYDEHLNERGHLVVSRAVIDFMQTSGLLKGRAYGA
jgi:hypothetical protein